MLWERGPKRSFTGVALAIIVLGAIYFVFGAIGWLANNAANEVKFAFPSLKLIGGTAVIALGYILYIVEEIRKK